MSGNERSPGIAGRSQTAEPCLAKPRTTPTSIARRALALVLLAVGMGCVWWSLAVVDPGRGPLDRTVMLGVPLGVVAVLFGLLRISRS